MSENIKAYQTEAHEGARASVLAGRRLLPREAAAYLYAAGWSEIKHLVEAVATFKQESQFFCEAVGGPNKNGSYDYGWPQINSDHAELFGFSDQDAFKQACFQPETAAHYARVLYTRDSYTLEPWVAYTSGDYEKFLGPAGMGAGNMILEQLGVKPVPYLVQA